MFKLLTISILLFTFSCNKENQDQVYSLPHWKDHQKAPLEKIAIAISNNEAGKTNSERAPIPSQILVPGLPTSIKFGGPSVLSSYIGILRKRYDNRLVLLDSGRFIKSDSNQEDQDSLLKLYKHLDYDALMFTEEEVIRFMDDPKKITNHALPYINSNIVNLRSKKLLTHKVVRDSIILNKAGVKIGIIGLTTYDGRKVISSDRFKGLYFEKPEITFLEYKNKLKRKGADIIILMANIKTNCESKLPPRTLNSPRPSWAKIYCDDKNDGLLRFLKRIPRGSLDLLVLGNSERQLRGFLLNTPVITTPPSSGYLGMAEIFYDKAAKRLVWDHSLLHPKIQLCENFFKVTSDCYLGDKIPGYNERIKRLKKSALQIKPAMFLGHEIKPDLKVNSFLPIMR